MNGKTKCDTFIMEYQAIKTNGTNTCYMMDEP